MELEKVLVIDPRTNVEETYKTKEVVYKSNVNNSSYVYTADSQSDTNIIFNNITPPSLNTILPRCLKVKYQLVINSLGAADGGAVTANIAAYVANAVSAAGASAGKYTANMILADSPLQMCCTAIELRVNGSSTSVSPNDYIMIYSHLTDNDDINELQSPYPHQKDTTALYSGAAVAGAVATLNLRSPFINYGGNTTTQSRAGFSWKLVSSGAAAAGAAGFNQYSVDIEEELYLSPLVWGKMQNAVAGLSNINNLTLNFRVDNWQRAIRCVPTDGTSRTFPANITVSSVGLAQIVAANPLPAVPAITATKAILDLNYITPDPVIAAKMPSVLAYDYSYLQTYITPVNVAAGSQLQFQSVRLPSIPKRMFIYAKPSKRILTGQAYNTIPDIFLRLTQVQITFNNRINLLANDTEQTLYLRSVSNGLKDSWVDWRYNTGSILCLDVAKDFGLEADECSGQSNKYSTLQITATFDTSPLLYWGSTQLAMADFDAYLLVEQPGKAFITPSDCQFVLTGPSSAEVLALTSSMDKVADHSDLDSKQVGGGSFGLGKLFKSGLNLVKNVNPDQVASGVKAVQNAMGAMGMGVAGGAMKHKRVY
jgi:hypothetical protein